MGIIPNDVYEEHEMHMLGNCTLYHAVKRSCINIYFRVVGPNL